MGWMMSFVVAACVPTYAIFALCCLHTGSFLQVRAQSNDTYTISQSINQSINPVAGDAPYAMFKETNHRRGHSL